MVTIIIVIGLLGIVLGSILRVAKHKRSLQLQQQRGLHGVVSLQSLIASLQSHRGLTMAYDQGDNTVYDELKQQEQRISELCHSLNNVLQNQCSWKGFRGRWQGLAATHHTGQHRTDLAQQHFNAHTAMIEYLLNVLEDFAEQHQLQASALSKNPRVGFVWRELLWNIESIGRCRAVGVKVLTQGHCNSVERTQLVYLWQKIKQLSHQTGQQLASDDTNLKYLLQKADQATQPLLTVVEQQLLSKHTKTITGQEYFQLASQSMAAFGGIFDYQVSQIQR